MNKMLDIWRKERMKRWGEGGTISIRLQHPLVRNGGDAWVLARMCSWTYACGLEYVHACVCASVAACLYACLSLRMYMCERVQMLGESSTSDPRSSLIGFPSVIKPTRAPTHIPVHRHVHIHRYARTHARTIS